MVGLIEKGGLIGSGIWEGERGLVRDPDVMVVWADDGFAADLPT